MQELAYLHSMTAAQYSAAEGRRAAEREAAERATDRLHASEVPVEVRWAAGRELGRLAGCALPLAALQAAMQPDSHSALRCRACPQPLAAGHAHTAESAAGADEGLCEICCHDFYEGVDFERQLVLRSSWLCAGAGSLRDIRRRLE